MGTFLEGFWELLDAFGRSWGALGALFGRSWGAIQVKETLSFTWIALGALLGRSWEGFGVKFGLLLDVF